MISIVIPAYNEAERLERNIETLIDFLEKNFKEFEIIIAEDGSTDGTDTIAKTLSERYKFIHHLHSDERIGKGKAVLSGIKKAKGDIVVYMDADLSTDLSHLRDVVNAVENGYDIAIGSRLLRESNTSRPFTRDFPSKVYNLLVRILLKSKIHDHQCGFKAFRKESILKIADRAKDSHWFWDTEILVLAQREGMRIKEVPVTWTHYRDGTVSVFKTSLYLLSNLIRYSERLFLYISIITALLIFLGLFIFVSPEKLLVSFVQLDPRYVGFALAIYPLSFILRGIRYELLMREIGGNLGIGYAFMATSISQSLNVITPIRIGDLGRAYVYARKGVTYQKSFSGLAGERIYDIIAILIIAFTGMVFVGAEHLGILVYALILVFLILGGVMVLSKTKGYVARVMSDAKELIFSRKAIVFIPLSLAVWLIDVVVCWIVLLSFTNSPLYLPGFAVAVGNIVKILPITPGGIGTYEATLTLILSSAVSRSQALAVSIADHGIKNIMTLILGLGSSIKLGIKLGEMRK